MNITGTTRAERSPATRPAMFLAPLNSPGLSNAHRVTDKVISGAQPEGDEGFKLLQALGVKTILSVDGAAPDVAGAGKYGLRYVHLPIEYSGVTPEQGRALAKALQELDGPVYVHCHHGKHRSAAAVTVACVYNGTLEPADAEKVLQTFGTGVNYQGLWSAAREARPLSAADLKNIHVNYVEIAKIPELSERMVHADQRLDRLKLAQKNGWSIPKDHPDIDPAHEALQLEELLHETGRLDESGKYPPEFKSLLDKSESGVKALKEFLSAKPLDQAHADAAIKNVSASCLDCHRIYRD